MAKSSSWTIFFILAGACNFWHTSWTILYTPLFILGPDFALPPPVVAFAADLFGLSDERVALVSRGTSVCVENPPLRKIFHGGCCSKMLFKDVVHVVGKSRRERRKRANRRSSSDRRFAPRWSLSDLLLINSVLLYMLCMLVFPSNPPMQATTSSCGARLPSAASSTSSSVHLTASAASSNIQTFASSSCALSSQWHSR